MNELKNRVKNWLIDYGTDDYWEDNTWSSQLVCEAKNIGSDLI